MIKIDRSTVWTIYNTYTNEILTTGAAPNGVMYRSAIQGSRYLEKFKTSEGGGINWCIARGDDNIESMKDRWVLIEIDFKNKLTRVVVDCPDDWWVGLYYPDE